MLLTSPREDRVGERVETNLPQGTGHHRRWYAEELSSIGACFAGLAGLRDALALVIRRDQSIAQVLCATEIPFVWVWPQPSWAACWCGLQWAARSSLSPFRRQPWAPSPVQPW